MVYRKYIPIFVGTNLTASIGTEFGTLSDFPSFTTSWANGCSFEGIPGMATGTLPMRSPIWLPAAVWTFDSHIFRHGLIGIYNAILFLFFDI
jgi:hypothetical protein